MIGPAAPPPELLTAAAQIPWEEDEEDVEDLIGPAPPEMAEELEGVGGDERIAEVARVIRYDCLFSSFCSDITSSRSSLDNTVTKPRSGHLCRMLCLSSLGVP